MKRRRIVETGGAYPRAGVTLMELIIVLGMVSVLLAIALPAMRAVHTASLKRRAAAEATELVQGALRYKEAYGFWPGEVKLVSDSDTKVKLHEDTPEQNGLKRATLVISAPEDILENLTENSAGSAGWLRLRTTGITENLHQARGMLTQRIFADPDRASTATIRLDVRHLQSGDRAGICIFQDPYA